MHMADALLTPAVGTTFWVASMGMIGYASAHLKRHFDEKTVPLMGVLAAFIFAGQMINFTIPGTGSSGHIGGGMILAIALGPHAAFLAVASVLMVQALFFADGGLLALGCNIWNLGFYPCFIAYPFIYKPLVGNSPSPRRILAAALVSVAVALQLGALSVVLETMLSGRSELHLGPFLLLMQPIHLAIGLVEGFITAGVINYVSHIRPEILRSITETQPLSPQVSLRKVLLTFLILTVVTGGGLSWFASTHPDGLEWSLEKVTGSPDLNSEEGGIAGSLEKVQEKTAILPDYSFKQPGEATASGDSIPSWPAVDSGTSLSGLLGALIVLTFTILIGYGIRTVRSYGR
jgi:cobalt/nickel transport system permease protein